MLRCAAPNTKSNSKEYVTRWARRGDAARNAQRVGSEGLIVFEMDATDIPVRCTEYKEQ